LAALALCCVAFFTAADCSLVVVPDLQYALLLILWDWELEQSMSTLLLSRRFVRFTGKMFLTCLASLICCGLTVPPGWAADAHYSNVTPDEHMKEWLLLGPIPAQEADVNPSAPRVESARKMGLEQDLLEKAGGEARISPKSGTKVDVRGGELKWKSHKSASDEVDLIDALGKHDFAVAYAAATFESQEDKTQLVGLGSDDGVRVWLNGELVHENPTPRALNVDDDVFSVKLKKGTNRLLIKVVNDEQDWGYAFRFLSPEILAKRLFIAASKGEVETVKKLVSNGVDAGARSAAGITAAQIAKARGHDEVVDFLVSKGAAPPQPFDAGPVVTAILEEISSDDAPGVAVLVARDGKVLLSHGFGMADLSHDLPIKTTTKFRIGSVTKQFAAAAILKLQEEKKLSVNDKLSKFFPDYPRGDEVTIHHLLTHTSGIKSFTSKPDFMKNVTAPASSREMIDSFKNDKFDFDPGTKMAYNNSGYFLLGAIVEKVSGKSFNDYLRDTFFEPLEMHDTGVHSSTAVLKKEATGYSYVGGTAAKAVNWDMSRAGAAGALYSTVEDLMRWNEGVFGGKVLSEESLKAAFTPVKLDSGEEPMMPYGYGWIIGEYRGLKTISHGGGLQGWLSFLTRYVDQNMTVVVLHNAMPPVPELSANEVAELVADAFLWQEMKPRPKYEIDESVDPTTFMAYVGRYDFMGAVMDVALDGGQLTAQLTGQPRFPIYPLGPDKFFWKVVDAQIEFKKDDEGHVVSAQHKQGGMNFSLKRLPEVKEVKVDEKTLDRYIGKYEYPGLGVLTVRRDEGKLKAQMTGQPEFEIYAKAPDVFFWKIVAAEIKFVADKDGKVEKAIHQQGGGTLEVKKIE
jgi:CubicO group peptidase (beta-lactamase class C family)